MMHSKIIERMDPVSQNKFIQDIIEWENRNIKPFTNYKLSPFSQIHHITEKPNSFPEEEKPEARCFEDLIKTFDKMPKEKYCYPITTSHEYGWQCQKPRNPDIDIWFSHNKKKTDMALYMQPKRERP